MTQLSEGALHPTSRPCACLLPSHRLPGPSSEPPPNPQGVPLLMAGRHALPLGFRVSGSFLPFPSQLTRSAWERPPSHVLKTTVDGSPIVIVRACAQLQASLSLCDVAIQTTCWKVGTASRPVHLPGLAVVHGTAGCPQLRPQVRACVPAPTASAQHRGWRPGRCATSLPP